jgi:hypothetical protein
MHQSFYETNVQLTLSKEHNLKFRAQVVVVVVVVVAAILVI